MHVAAHRPMPTMPGMTATPAAIQAAVTQPAPHMRALHAAHVLHAESCVACAHGHAGAKNLGDHSTHGAAHAQGSGVAAASARKKGKRVATHVLKMRMYMGKGDDGKIHALASHANFSVKAGEKVTLKITNEDDDMDHSFTSPDLGVDVKLPHAKDGKPTVKTVTFTAKKAGKLEWYCSVPCDPKAMATNGMMRGTITVS